MVSGLSNPQFLHGQGPGDSQGEGGLILLTEGRVGWGGRDSGKKKCHIQVVTLKENVDFVTY